MPLNREAIPLDADPASVKKAREWVCDVLNGLNREDLVDAAERDVVELAAMARRFRLGVLVPAATVMRGQLAAYAGRRQEAETAFGANISSRGGSSVQSVPLPQNAVDEEGIFHPPIQIPQIHIADVCSRPYVRSFVHLFAVTPFPPPPPLIQFISF